MELDVDKLFEDMVAAVKGVVAGRWPEIQNLAEDELKALAELLVRIEARKAAGTISDDDARSLLKIHRNTVETVLASIQGMTLIAAEMAVNAALNVVKEAVNKALNFDLL